VSGPDVKWSYASRDDELEAVCWYLTGRLDSQTKLDSQLGAIVNIYEHLRHAVTLPDLGRFLQLPMRAIGACEWIWHGIHRRPLYFLIQ
jgi:hypothetical protein